MKDQQRIACLGRLLKAAFDPVTIIIADGTSDDGKRFVVCVDEKLTAFIRLEAAIQSRLK